MSDFHPDWNAEKAAEHLADLDARAATERAIYDAMTDAADEHLRDAYHAEAQAKHCREMFSKPKPVHQ